MKTWILLLISTVCFMGFTLPEEEETYSLTIVVKEIPTAVGTVRMGLYNHKNQYTDNPWTSLDVPKTNYKNKSVTHTKSGLKKGDYVITLLDDLNDNQKMDYSFFGIPEEGYGFSNNIEPSFLGAPDYEDCTFTVNKDTTITIRVQEW